MSIQERIDIFAKSDKIRGNSFVKKELQGKYIYFYITYLITEQKMKLIFKNI